MNIQCFNFNFWNHVKVVTIRNKLYLNIRSLQKFLSDNKEGSGILKLKKKIYSYEWSLKKCFTKKKKLKHLVLLTTTLHQKWILYIWHGINFDHRVCWGGFFFLLHQLNGRNTRHFYQDAGSWRSVWYRWVKCWHIIQHIYSFIDWMIILLTECVLTNKWL